MKKRSKVKGATITKLFLLVAMMGLIFTGCKDYDDDIDSLQTDVTELQQKLTAQEQALTTAKTDLTGQISTLTNTVNAQKTALEKAIKDGDDAAIAKANDALTKANDALTKANDALTQITGILADIVDLKTNKVSKTELQNAVAAIDKKIADITPTLNLLLSQVTGLVFMPDNVIDSSPVIYGFKLKNGTSSIGSKITLKYQVNPKNAKYVNVVGLKKQSAKSRAAEDIVDIPLSANDVTLENGILTVNVDATAFAEPTPGTKNLYALVIDNKAEDTENRYISSEYVTSEIIKLEEGVIEVKNDPLSLDVVYDNSKPVFLTPKVLASTTTLNEEGFEMAYEFKVDDAIKDYFSVDQTTGLVTVKGGYAAIGKSGPVTITVTKVNGITLVDANKKSINVTLKAIESAPTTGDLGTKTVEFIYGSKSNFTQNVFNLNDFYNISGMSSSDFATATASTNVKLGDTNFAGTNFSLSENTSTNALVLNVTPDITGSNIDLDKVYTVTRTYTFSGGRKYVATVNVKVKTPTFVSNRIPSYWDGNILKTQGSIVEGKWEMSTDLKNAYNTGAIQIVGSTTSIFTANDMTFIENPNDANVTIAGSVISLNVSGASDADIQKYLNGSKKSNIDVKVTKNGRTLTLESIQVQFASPLTITVTPVTFNAADGHPDKVWSQVITIKGIVNDSNLKVIPPATESDAVKYEVDAAFMTRYNIAIGDIDTGNPNLKIDWSKANNEWIKYINTIPLANDLTATYDVVVKFGDPQKYSQTAQLPVTIKK